MLELLQLYTYLAYYQINHFIFVWKDEICFVVLYKGYTLHVIMCYRLVDLYSFIMLLLFVYVFLGLI